MPSLLGVGYEETLQAIPEYQKAIELSGGDQDPAAALANAYATLGKRAEAEKILGEWQRQSQTSYISPYMIATAYASLGKKNEQSLRVPGKSLPGTIVRFALLPESRSPH